MAHLQHRVVIRHTELARERADGDFRVGKRTRRKGAVFLERPDVLSAIKVCERPCDGVLPVKKHRVERDDLAARSKSRSRECERFSRGRIVDVVEDPFKNDEIERTSYPFTDL